MRQNDPISTVLAPSRDDELNQVTSEQPLRLRAVQPHVNTRELSTLSTFSFFLPSVTSLHEISILVYIRANNQAGIYIASPFHI